MLFSVFAVIALLLVLFIVFFSGNSEKQQASSDVSLTTFSTLTKTEESNGLTIDATLQNFKYGQPVTIALAFNTHQGNPDYDIIKISILVDENGKEYKPISWNGPPLNGHHVSGVLTFEAVQEGVQTLTLKILNVYDTPERTFTWDIS